MRKTIFKMKRLMKSRKAVSPVIAVILLIAIAVAASVTVFAYTQGIIGGVATANLQVTQPTLLETAGNDDTFLLRVQNSGGQSMTISRIDFEYGATISYGSEGAVWQVYDATTGELIDNDGDGAYDMDLTLNPGESKSLEIRTGNDDLQAGQYVLIEIWDIQQNEQEFSFQF